MKQNIFLSPIQKFIKAESFSGKLLFLSMCLALVFSNSPISESFSSIWLYEFGIKGDSFTLVKPLILWINDGLMAIFFFLIGLEIKREILIGELNSLKKASLPIFAAIGGMVIPILVFLLLNNNPETSKGWGIPMATDIAFTLAILKLLGNKIPLSLKIFLTAFAIIDDIGAVLVIAFFYTSAISWNILLIAFVLLIILLIKTHFRLFDKITSIILSIIIWILFLKSGVHPTIAGILLAFTIPLRQKITEFKYVNSLEKITKEIIEADNTNKLPLLSKKQIDLIEKLSDCTKKVQSPLQSLEHRLHYWVAFLIMPIFALSNAGIEFSSDMAIDNSLAINIAVALLLGKTIGVSLFSYIGLKLNLATLPNGTKLKDIIGIAILSGVGFTMSLFISGLAFPTNEVFINSSKIGIIAGSLIAGIIGYIILFATSKKRKTEIKKASEVIS